MRRGRGRGRFTGQDRANRGDRFGAFFYGRKLRKAPLNGVFMDCLAAIPLIAGLEIHPQALAHAPLIADFFYPWVRGELRKGAGAGWFRCGGH